MALLPALLLAAFAFFCGTFPGAAQFPQGPIGHLLVLAAALAGASSWKDPLGLGPTGRIVPWALLVAVAASAWASPVPRAGRVALLLLPAFLLIPAFVARCWSTPERRATGVAGVAAVAVAVATAALLDPSRAEIGRAAMPLGHHNLLAAFLVIVAPLVLLGFRRAGPARWLALSALVATIAAVAASRSFLHAGVLAGVVVAGAWRFERLRELMFGGGLLAIALLAPRAAAIVAGEDPSTAARAVYLRAAWTGALERPWLGWGPGSTPWTLAESARPLPGVNPPGEIVAEAHSLPLQLLRELGGTGFAFAAVAAALFFRVRRRELRSADDPALVEAGALSLAAGLLSGLGGAWFAVPALPLALAVGAGATLAGSRRFEPAPAARWPVVVYAVGALALLAPTWIAHQAYRSAIRADSRAAAVPLLERAVRFDPDFPLYRARLAWADSNRPAEVRAAEAIRAANAARGVAALWMRAGHVALEAGDRESAARAFERALRLDPLSAFAPFQLAPLVADPAGCAARAFVAEPRLAGAALFRGREAARRAAIARAGDWRGVDAGWRERFLEVATGAAIDGSSTADLSLSMDATPSLSLSLHAFRRSLWPTDLARIPVERKAVRGLKGLPSASSMKSSSAAAFPAERCVP